MDPAMDLLVELAHGLTPMQAGTSGVTSCFLHGMAKSYSLNGQGLSLQDRRGRAAMALVLDFESVAELAWCVESLRLRGTDLVGCFGDHFFQLLHARARPVHPTRDASLLRREQLRVLNHGGDLTATDFLLLLAVGDFGCISSPVRGWYTRCYACGARSRDGMRTLKRCPCLGAAYCNAACQLADWNSVYPRHKFLCLKLREGPYVVAPVKAPPQLSFFTKVRFVPREDGTVEFIWPQSPGFARYADRLHEFPTLAESWAAGRSRPPAFDWALGHSWFALWKQLRLDGELNIGGAIE
jgi:MYND finger